MARILFVEDDDVVRFALVEYLRRANHEVREAVDGGAALKLIEAEPFDIVVTDIIMPNVDGMELITRLMMRDSNLPVIAISGGGRIGKKEYLSLAKDLGACAIVEKPIDPKVLLEYIDQFAIP